VFFNIFVNVKHVKKQSFTFSIFLNVREFLNNIAENFAHHAEIKTVTSVDEQMIPFKGQLGLKVYMKNKPKKWGVKIWTLAGQSGYVYRCSVSGDNCSLMKDEEMEDLDLSIGMSGQTVLGLLQRIPPGVQVFFDNYFASPALLVRLK
jgi:hypothetical protein